MRIFLISMDFELWSIVENGFQKSSLPMSEWNESEKKVFALNAKAMNALFCALDKNEFNRVSMCDSAFDIWRTLEVTQVKLFKFRSYRTKDFVKIEVLIRCTNSPPPS